MAFCGNCGTKVEDGVKFCPGCGAGIAAQAQPNTADQQQAQQTVPPAQENTQQTYQQQVPPNANTGAQQEAEPPKNGDWTDRFDPADIEKNKAMGLLGYILFFIPLLAAKDSPFAKYHANQGLVLFLAGLIVSFVGGIIPFLGWFIILPIGSIIVAVLGIMGIINALGGKAKDLPIIGKIKILK